MRWSPSYGSADCRSLTFGSPKKKQGLRSNLESVQSACRLIYHRPGQAESGHRFFTVSSVDLTDAICSDTSVSRNGCSSFGMNVGLLETATVLRDTYSRGSIQTKVMRSASSEDIRSEARRAMRTREGKGRPENSFS